MSHEIDLSNNRENMAYVGDTPWHGLGHQLAPGASIETWKEQAGLNWMVERAPAHYYRGDVLHVFKDRHVLYRNDTGAPLSVVGKDYKIVQPGMALDFFRKIADAGAATMETAGSLAGGKKVWALAKVNDGANIIGHDEVRPYLLFATSFDGGLSTTVKFTTVRVVCDNTLTMSAGGRQNVANGGQTERDVTDGPVVQCVRISHDRHFDADEVRQQIGLALDAWDRFLIEARIMANKELDPKLADEMTYDLIEPTVAARPGMPMPDIRKSKGYQKIMALYSGEAKGHDLTEGPTAWRWINSITEYVDWHRGRSRETGLDSAWFGAGEGLKNRAKEMALSA